MAGLSYECVKCAVHFRPVGGTQPLLCPACRPRPKASCIGCGRTENVLHADDCSHINGTMVTNANT